MKLHTKILISIIVATIAGLLSREFGFEDIFIKNSLYWKTFFKCT